MATDKTPDMYLNRQEIAFLTGVSRGKDGKTREQLQIASLKKLHLPFFENDSGRPVVVRTVLQGGIVAANDGEWHSTAKS